MDDLLVVGGGISGLSLAHHAARQGRSVRVLERSERPGGCVRSVAPAEVPPGGEPFWFEMGSHSLYNSYASLIGLLEACGLQGRTLAREKLGFYLLVDGKLRTIGSQLHIPELVGSLPRLLVTRRAGQSIRSYYARVLGARNYERVFKAMFDAVACQDTSDFGVEYLFKKRPSRRKDYRRSFTLAGGLGTLIDALAATPGVTLETGAQVEAVTRDQGAFQVRLAGGSARAARVLALAVPPSRGAALLEGCFPDIAKLLAEIKLNRLFSVGVTIGRDAVAVPPLAGIVAPGDSFFSAVSRDVVPHPESRAFTFHFRDGDDEANLTRIAQVLGVPRERFDRVETAVHDLPTLGVDHAERIRRLDGLAAGRNLLVTGNYLKGLSLEDCVSRSADEAAKLLKY